MSITISNTKICEFYKKYPDVNIETVNLFFIDIIEKFAGNNVNMLEDRLIESITSVKTQISDINNSNLENIKSFLKLNFYENKDEINQLLSTNKNDLVQTVSSLTNKNNDLDKVLTQNNELYLEKLNNAIPKNLLEEIKSLMHNEKTEEVMAQLSDFLNKYKHSPFHKGQYAQNMLEVVLNNCFPSAEIIDTSKTSHSGDFIIKRDAKSDIMIENKDYKTNVKFEEIPKFQNDCENLGMHGVFLSQFSGIGMKRDFSLEIINGKILIYLHNVEYNNYKILTAIDIIDNLSEKLSEYNTNTEYKTDMGITHNIDQETVDKINEELTNFMSQKENMSLALKEHQKRMEKLLDDMKLPELSKYFGDKCSSIKIFKCEYCNLTFPNKRALGSHIKVHKPTSSSKKQTIHVET